MDKAETSKNIKKVIMKFAVVFFIVMLILLFFSKTVENMLLPAVTVCSPISIDISDTYEFITRATVANTNKAYPYFDYFIEDVLIEDTQIITKNTPIATLRDTDVLNKKTQFEQEIYYLENSVEQIQSMLKKWMNNEDKEKVEKQLAMAQKSLLLKQDEMDFYFSKIDDDNNLISGVSGQIVNIKIKEQSYINKTSVLFDYTDDDSYWVIKWHLPEEKAENFNGESVIEIQYTYMGMDEDDEVIEIVENQKLEINDKIYDFSSKSYEFIVKLDNEVDQNIIDSIKIEVTLSSKPIDIVNAIPKSALSQDSTTDGYILYTLIEDFVTKELTVKKSTVNIISDYGIYCVTEAAFVTDIILSTTKPLSDGMRVKLK